MNKHLSRAVAMLWLVLPLSAVAAQVDRQLDVAEDSLVQLESQFGEVVVQGWEQNQISITGHLDEAVKELVVEQQGKQVLIKVVNSEEDDNQDHSGTELLVRMPYNADLDAVTMSADLSVAELNSPTSLESVSGNITASKINNNFSAESISGDVTIMSVSGRTRLKSISGDIEGIDLSGELTINNVSGDVKIQSQGPTLNLENVSGDVSLQLSSVRELMAKSVSGDLSVATAIQPSADLRMMTVSGDAKLQVLGDINARFSLAAQFGGDINNRLNDKQPDEGNIGSELEFSEGEGRAKIMVTTVSGSIDLEAAK